MSKDGLGQPRTPFSKTGEKDWNISLGQPLLRWRGELWSRGSRACRAHAGESGLREERKRFDLAARGSALGVSQRELGELLSPLSKTLEKIRLQKRQMNLSKLTSQRVPVWETFKQQWIIILCCLQIMIALISYQSEMDQLARDLDLGKCLYSLFLMLWYYKLDE